VLIEPIKGKNKPMRKQRPISLSRAIGEKVKLKKTLEAFKNALQYI